jgi:hypothetical protein
MIHTKDALRNPQIKEEKDRFKVILNEIFYDTQNKSQQIQKILPVSPKITYRQNGIYSVVIKLDVVGTVQIRVTFNEIDVNGSPLTLNISKTGNCLFDSLSLLFSSLCFHIIIVF